MLRRIITSLGYLAGAAVIVLATVSLVAYGQGYSYDFKTGRIIRTGLVIIQSTPTGATIWLNGKKLKKKTNYRQSFERGRYTFELKKDGYHPWKKAFDVVASEVSLVQYALLVPLKPVTKVMDTRPNVVAQNISPDHRHLVYATSGVDGAVYSLNLENDSSKPAKLFTPRAATAELPAENVTEARWSDDASHLLVVTQAGDITTHYLMTAAGSQVINLTDQYRFNFTGLRFAANNWRQLYWISPDGLRRLDVEAQSVSGVLADRVRQFQVAGERVLYVQPTQLGESLWSIDVRGHKQELIAALPESESYGLAYANYKGEDQLAVVPSRTRVGTIYTNIFSSTPVAKTVARDVAQTLFSPDGHVLAFYDQNHLVTYDLERSELTDQLVTHEFAGVQGLTALSWYDSFHLLLNQQGKLILAEFDGANTLDLGDLAGAFPAYNSPDLREIVSFRPGEAGALRVEQLVIRP